MEIKFSGLIWNAFSIRIWKERENMKRIFGPELKQEC